MGWPQPRDTKSAVKKAGDRIRKDDYSVEDITVLNNWRAAHGYIINTFQAALRNRAKGWNVPVAQRLKRASTIIDKLRQGRAKDLSTMHDIAGVRMVFPDETSLRLFRYGQLRTRAKHELVNEPDKYNYLLNPKSSGYRGIHDVYSYSAGSETGGAWNGLLIELQYRTLIQHAWATAVELSDVLTHNRTKFSQGHPDNTRFFQICSELLARRWEGAFSCLPDQPYETLIEEWHEIEQRAHLFHQLKSVGRDEGGQGLHGLVLLIMREDMTVQQIPQKSYRSALQTLLKIEAENPELDVVLVGGAEDTIRQTFRNYFKNATEFVSLVEGALAQE